MANATAEAAGLVTIHNDVTTFNTTPGAYDVHLGSPSCKRYSAAGNGAGRRALDQVLAGVQVYRDGGALSHEQASHLIGDKDAALTLEPLRIALQGLPTFIAWEQTPAVLPVWQACADVLTDHRYSVATGILNAEQHGIPQTRRRAILIARADGVSAELPSPTHSRFYPHDPRRLDPGVKPWVSMAEALGWNLPGSWSAHKSMGRGMVERHGSRPGRSVLFPSFTIRADAGGMEPGGFRLSDEAEPRQFVRLEPAQAARLQTFPNDFPWRGNKGEVFRQIGNAVPPLLAESIITHLAS